MKYIILLLLLFVLMCLLIFSSTRTENFDDDEKYQSIKLNPSGYWRKGKWHNLRPSSNSFEYYDVQRNCLRCETRTRSECDRCFNCGWYMINNHSNGLCLKRNSSDLYENIVSE